MSLRHFEGCQSESSKVSVDLHRSASLMAERSARDGGRAGVDDLGLVGFALVSLVLSVGLECSLGFAHLAHVVVSAAKCLDERPQARGGALAVDHAREGLSDRREVLVDHVERGLIVAELERGERHAGVGGGPVLEEPGLAVVVD